MLKFNDLMDTVNNLSKDQLQQLQDAVANKQEEKVNKVFIPKDGDTYWNVGAFGIICRNIFHKNGRCSEWDFKLGNCYRTEEEAEFAKQKKLVEVELQRFADEHNDEIDLNSTATSKWYFYIRKGSLLIADVLGGRDTNIYFSSDELVKQAIKQVGEYRIKKYLFGVTE